jgi:hypothetical protein
MNTTIQAGKSNTPTKTTADYQKAVIQNQKASPNESAPAFTKAEPVKGPANPPLQAAKGNDEVMSQPPQPETAPKTKPEPAIKNPVPKETAQEPVHQVMKKDDAKKIETEVAASTSAGNAPAKDKAKATTS